MLIVFADPGQGIARDSAAIRTVIILARQIHQINRQRFSARAIHAEGIPIGLAIAPILIAFAVHATAPMRGIHSLNFAERAAFKVSGDGDGFGSNSGKSERAKER